MKVKFVRNTGQVPDSWFDEISLKKVDYVIEYRVEDRLNNANINKAYDLLGGKYLDCKITPAPCIVWNGTTEDGFFIISFSDGLLGISFDEREMFLNCSIKIAGYTEFVSAVHSNSLNKKQCSLTAATEFDETIGEYYTKNYPEEVKNITFNDVLDFLGWKLKKGTTIEEACRFYH